MRGPRFGRDLRRGVLRTAAAVATATLGACAAIAPTPALDTFDLGPVETAAASAPRSLQVLVPEPTADRAFDTDRIVVRPSAAEIAYFSGAQWSDRLPRLLQSRLIAALERSGRFRAAGRPGQGLAIDRQILTEIRAFDYEASTGRVVVSVVVKLMDDRTGRVLTSATFGAEEASADDARSAAAALDRAQKHVFADVVAWVAKRG